jgi:hypothetical protein
MEARLLKVIVQPVFVVEEDEELREILVQPVQLSAKEWRILDPTAWAQQGACQIEAQLNGGPVAANPH